MTVLADAISIIVPVQRIQGVWPGGAHAYATEAAPDTHCADTSLTRVGFEEPADAWDHLDRLEGLGLRYDSLAFADVAVVVDGRFAAGCDWMAAEHVADGYSRCWAIADGDGELVIPDDWDVERSITWTRQHDATWLNPNIIDVLDVEEHDDGESSVTGYRFGFPDRRELAAMSSTANRLAASGQHVQAVPLWRRLAAIDGRNGNLFALAASLHLCRGPQAAIPLYDRVLATEPEDQWTLSNKGFALGQLGRCGEALPLLERAIAIDPKDASAWWQKGLVEEALSRYDEADRSFFACVQICGGIGDTGLAALARDRIGRHGEVPNGWNLMLAPIWAAQAASLVEDGRREEALDFFRRSTLADPAAPDAWFALGELYSDLGDSSKAHESFDRCILLEPAEVRGWAAKWDEYDLADDVEGATRCQDQIDRIQAMPGVN